MARVELVRHVAADPSGLALLLSGPAGRELWPGEDVSLGGPQRSGLGFLVDLEVAGTPLARGRITITAGHGGPVGSEVLVTFSVPVTEAASLRAEAAARLAARAAAPQALSSAA